MPKKRPGPSSVRQENVSFLRTSELLAKFLASQGIPYDAVRESSFSDLMHDLNPTFTVPTSAFLEEMTARMALRDEKSIPADVKEVSVTFDVFGSHDDEVKMLAFSFHFTPWVYGYAERENIVYLRRIGDGQLTGSKIIDCVREMLNRDHKQYSKIANIVISNEKIAKLFNMDNKETRHKICFYRQINIFVERILKLENVATILKKLRKFVRLVRDCPETNSKWKKIQHSRTGLPVIDHDRSWESTTKFLEHYLLIDQSFRQLHAKHGVHYDVLIEEIQKVSDVCKILQKCLLCSRDISSPRGSVSQLMPSIIQIKHCISETCENISFKETILLIVNEVFATFLSSDMVTQYNISTLLDPRYAYRTDLYSTQVWNDIEHNLIQDFISKNQEVPSGSDWKEEAIKEYRLQMITKELGLFKNLCQTSPAVEGQSVSNWWNFRQKDILHLAVLARENAVCPIASIDAKLYFGEGGKFAHFSKIYTNHEVDSCLRVAGYEQLYRGKGASFQAMPIDTFERLSVTTNVGEGTSQKGIHFGESNDFFEDENVILSQKRVKMEEMVLEDVSEEQKPGTLLDVKQEEPSTSAQQYVVYDSDIIPVEMVDIKDEPQDYELEYEDGEFAWEEYVDDLDPTQFEEFEEEEVENPTEEQVVNLPLQKSRRKRYCAVCGKFQESRYIKEVTIITEKLLIVFGAVKQEEVSDETARKLFAKGRIVVCRVHFVETCISIFELLNVSTYDNISNLPEEAFSSSADIMERFSGKRINSVDLRATFTAFTQKYNELTTARIDYESTSSGSQAQTVVRNTSCFCCGSLGNRELMVQMPDNAVEWAQWMKILSIPFQVVDECVHEAFLCKTHFTPDSFTKIGRLRKGVLPVPRKGNKSPVVFE